MKQNTIIDDNVLQNISFFIWQFSNRKFSKLGLQLSLGMNREEFLRVCSQFLCNKNVIHKQYSDNIIHTIRMVTTRAGLFLYWYILLFLSKLSRRVIGFSKLDNWHHTQLTLLHQFKMTLEEYVSKKNMFYSNNTYKNMKAFFEQPVNQPNQFDLPGWIGVLQYCLCSIAGGLKGLCSS